MANWSNPLLTSNYVNFVDEVKGRDDDAARQFDPATTSATNVPVNTIRWNGSANRWEKWSGTAWNVLSSGYAISITGNAATASVWQTGRTLTIGNTGKSVNGGANVSWTLAEIGAVGLTGNETVAGQKTFSSPPVLNFAPATDTYTGWGNGFSIADTAAPFGAASVVASFVFNSNRGIQFATNSSADNQPLAFRRVHTSLTNGLGAWTNLVDVAADQTVGGNKTFSNPIVVPNAVSSNQAINLGQLQALAGGFKFKDIVNLTATTTLAASNAGDLIVATPASAGITLTLPAASAVPAGSTITVFSASNLFTTNVNRAGSDTIRINHGTATTQSLGFGDTIVLASNGSNQWVLTGGTKNLENSFVGQNLVTTSTVLAATAGASVGAVGTYAFCGSVSGNLFAGDTLSGSDLRYSNANANDPSGTPVGTWRLMGRKTNSTNFNAQSTSLWLRIS